MSTKKRFLRTQVEEKFFSMIGTRGTIGICPITRRTFVWLDDPIRPLINYAVRAEEAREQFRLQNFGLPGLPLSYSAREKMKRLFGVGYLVALYGRSLAACGYRMAKHPNFERYASGMMAQGHFRQWALRDAPELLSRYAPDPLPNLDGSGYFKVQKRPRKKSSTSAV